MKKKNKNQRKNSTASEKAAEIKILMPRENLRVGLKFNPLLMTTILKV